MTAAYALRFPGQPTAIEASAARPDTLEEAQILAAASVSLKEDIYPARISAGRQYSSSSAARVTDHSDRQHFAKAPPPSAPCPPPVPARCSPEELPRFWVQYEALEGDPPAMWWCSHDEAWFSLDGTSVHQYPRV